MNRYDEALNTLDIHQKYPESKLPDTPYETIRHALSVMSQLTEARKKATAGEWFTNKYDEHEILTNGNDGYIGVCNHYKLLGSGEEKENERLYKKNRDNAAFITLAANLTREDT